MINVAENIYQQELSIKDFNRLSELIYCECGINLLPEKKVMVESRLRKRLKQLNINSFKEYVELIFNDKSRKEIVPLIDSVSTNKSEFYREVEHFNYLYEKIIPELLQNNYNKRLSFWSAASSSGEEAYTLAIFLSEYNFNVENFKYEIYAADISTDILKKAITAIYPIDKVENVPQNILRKYFLKRETDFTTEVRVIKNIRNKVKFFRNNLIGDKYNLPSLMDVIFCRNVLIYFDKKTQQKVIQNLLGNLNEGGYLIMGHSETLRESDFGIKRETSTVYKKI